MCTRKQCLLFLFSTRISDGYGSLKTQGAENEMLYLARDKQRVGQYKQPTTEVKPMTSESPAIRSRIKQRI